MFRSAAILLALFTALTGFAYPLFVTALAQLAFGHEANGSLQLQGGRVLDSTLIGRDYRNSGEFWGRPSATSPSPYNAAASSGSNLGPTNPVLITAVRERVAALHAADPGQSAPVPIDLVTASGSGLDPHISPAAALYQVPRVARARGLPLERVRSLVHAHIEPRTFGVLGEPRVNVLQLNLALDQLAASDERSTR